MFTIFFICNQIVVVGTQKCHKFHRYFIAESVDKLASYPRV